MISSSLTTSVRYLEIDSSYRDRVLYPEPATFIVEMSQSGQGNSYSTANDPVSNASPILVWNNLFKEYIPSGPFIPPPPPVLPNKLIGVWANPVGTAIIGFLSGTTRFQIYTSDVGGDFFRQIRNYYVGCSLSKALPTGIVSRRIIDYVPITLNDAIVTIESPLPDNVCNSSYGFYIQNPTPLPTDTLNTVIKMFVPGSNKYGIDTMVVPVVLDPQPKQLETPGLGGDNYYINYYIQNLDTGTYRKITAFDASTRLATLDSPTPPGEDWSTAVIVPIPPLFEYGKKFAIRKEIPEPISSLPFSRDNAVQFNFTGSTVVDEQAEYKIELLNLILPNTVLKSGRGGRAIFYPYFYVELLQLSKGTTQSMNIIYSNNPNSSRMLFRAVVDDTVKPEISPFIKIDGDGMTHTLRISPSDSFRFSVYHPDGDLFKTDTVDMYSPTEPNPLAQISACFSFEKIIS